MRQRTLQLGLWQHHHLGGPFEGQEIFSAEGKAAMAQAHRRWRTAGFVLTRWQMQLFRSCSKQPSEVWHGALRC